MKVFIKATLALMCGIAFSSPAAAQDLTGAGATFPFPIYDKWFHEYAATRHVQINYQPIGSGGGIKQLTEGTVDFGATDAPMSDAELAKAKGPVMHIPTVLGAVVVTYNVPELKQQLRLDGTTLAAIFLGEITKWNDARITRLNPGAKLPAADILVVHRSDGSGTSYVFTDYLTKVSAGWAAKPGKGKDVQWPIGLGGKGNDGVTGQVKQLPGSIGYVELAYAKQNKLPYAAMRNASGAFVSPTIEAVTAAAAGAKLPANTDYRVSIVDATGKGAYPISSFTWLLVYEKQADAEKGRKLLDFVRWALTDGEKSASSLDYAPIPAAMAKQLVKRLGGITVAAR